MSQRTREPLVGSQWRRRSRRTGRGVNADGRRQRSLHRNHAEPIKELYVAAVQLLWQLSTRGCSRVCRASKSRLKGIGRGRVESSRVESSLGGRASNQRRCARPASN